MSYSGVKTRDSMMSGSGVHNNMKGSVQLKAGTLHEVNQQVTHPYTKLDLESSQMIAERIFKHYTGGGYSSSITPEQAKRMIQDAYKAVGRRDEPSEDDIKDYIIFHDRDGDQLFTQKDLENACAQYLCGPGGSGLSLLGKHTARENLIEYFVQDEDPNVVMPDLAHIDKLFDSYDKDGNGELDRNEVRRLIADTYRLIGKDKQITDQDIDIYMGGKDRMTKRAYEENVIGSMAKRHLLKLPEN